jgi:TusA-related sulfurtransferase
MTDEAGSASARMTVTELSPVATIDAGPLGLSTGLLLQLRTTLAPLEAGSAVEVRSARADLRQDLAAWCRLNGHELIAADAGDHSRFFIRKGPAAAVQPRPNGGSHPPVQTDGGPSLRDWLAGHAGQPPVEAPVYYGFVPRGAAVEPGTPSYPFRLNRRADVWAANIAELYEQATAQQWHAGRDVPWPALAPLPEEIERAVCQVMTFLAENEYSALYIPAKFLPRINAQYVEVVLFLSTVINDEARHIEVFTKRALANGGGLQVATALTEWSLYSLFVQEDYFRSGFLLHVLGEGAFLELLEFVERYAPDPVTAEIARRARLDEGRHVAYGIAHVRERLRAEPVREQELVAAAEERVAALQATSGANLPLAEALAVLAGGGTEPSQLARGVEAVRTLFQEMAERRVHRLQQLGLSAAAAEQISALHTPNFM